VGLEPVTFCILCRRSTN